MQPFLGLSLSLLCTHGHPKLNKLFPSQLLALIVGTGLYLLFFKGGNAKILGDIPTGLPALHMPAFNADLLVDMIKVCIGACNIGRDRFAVDFISCR